MPLLPDLPRIQNAVELLDGPASLSELEANFRDISRLNRYFGGSWGARSHLVRLLGGRPGGGGGGAAAISSLPLPHLEPDAAPGLLAEMGRTSRLGFVVNDLMRSRFAYVLVWLTTRLFAWNRMSRHDGPLSVRRAYSAREIGALAERAGVAPGRITRHPLCLRLAVVGGVRSPSTQRFRYGSARVRARALPAQSLGGGIGRGAE